MEQFIKKFSKFLKRNKISNGRNLRNKHNRLSYGVAFVLNISSYGYNYVGKWLGKYYKKLK